MAAVCESAVSEALGVDGEAVVGEAVYQAEEDPSLNH